MVATGELSYNGLTIGAYSGYSVQSVDFGTPDIRMNLVTKSEEHGAFSYGRFLEPRTVTIDGTILGSSVADRSSRENTLKSAFVPQPVDLPLSFFIPGESARRVNCIPSKPPYMTHDNGLVSGAMKYAVQLLAGDPRIYSDTETTLTLANNVGQIATNSGTFSTPPTAVITSSGTITAITIYNDTLVQSLTLSGITSYSAAGNITVNFAQRTVVQGATNLYATLSSVSTWWALNPGANTVRFVVTGTGTPSVSFKFRSAWL